LAHSNFMGYAGLMFRSVDGSPWSDIRKGSGAVSVEDPLSAIVAAVPEDSNRTVGHQGVARTIAVMEQP
jgi:hypothetical protein